MPPSTPARIFSRGSWSEAARIAAILRKETVSGALVLGAAVLALVWANSPFEDSYHALRDARIGPASLHLNLALSAWASDGLLALFFFVVGLELKREFVAGDLRSPRRAALPVFAAVGGMLVPAALFVVVNLGTTDGALRGWAIPTATDIAFALAVLAIVGTHLPIGLRTFLLTLAVVDDLLAVVIIGIAYTSHLQLGFLVVALLPLACFAVAVQRRIRSWWLLLPLATLTWALVHASGVHATIAGVLLGFAVPVALDRTGAEPALGSGLAEHFEHRFRPISAGFAVPVFALLAAGVHIGGMSGFVSALTDRAALGVVVGLVLGKTVGIFGTTYLLSRFTHAELDEDIRWLDVLGVSVLAGIGFTVSLLIGGLAFGADDQRNSHVTIGVLVGSVLAAVIAVGILSVRNRVYRRIAEAESRDADHDGVPDVYQT
ncbi:MAG: Na+/H+ antiporter NhaA [Chloroflexota bacterium]